MKHIFLIALLICLTSVAVVAAQPPPPFPLSEDQTIIERCITAPAEPPDDYSFEGTIVTFNSVDGLHGFRMDTPSRYYIAFSNDTEYSRFGAFSPDGRWFASYLGRMEREYSMMFNNSYYITHLRIVSTLPDRQSYLFPIDLYQYRFNPYFNSPIWADETQVLLRNGATSAEAQGWSVINPFIGTSRDATAEEAETYTALYLSQQNIQYEGSFDRPYYPGDALMLENGMPRAFNTYTEAQPGGSGSLLITDTETGAIYDTCISVEYAFALSPTGNQVAIGIGAEAGFVYIVDLNDWQAYRLDLAANDVVGWLPEPEG
jgi:hypothetical protein